MEAAAAGVWKDALQQKEGGGPIVESKSTGPANERIFQVPAIIFATHLRMACRRAPVEDAFCE